MILPASSSVPRPPTGRHHLESGTTLPGFPTTGATPERYQVAVILERHGRGIAPVTRRAR